MAMAQSELTRCGFPRQRGANRVGTSTWSICAVLFVTLLADMSAARDVSRVENFFRAHQQNLGPSYSSVTLPNFFRCHDSGFRDYQGGHSWQMQKTQFFARHKINPALQYVDEGCYSWGMCDVLNKISPRNCSYITMFRDPKERLVSAFIYCIYRQPQDQCCGWNRFYEDQHYDKMREPQKAAMRRNASIVDFARHWGSFGFRQFLINDESINYEKIVGTPKLLWPAWYAIAQIFAEDGLDTDRTENGRARLANVIEQIEREVAVVGIVERWDETVDLLNYAYGWEEFAHEVQSVNVMSHKNRHGVPMISAEETLKLIERDAEVARLLSADQVLYDAALALFEKQKMVYDRLH